MKLKAKLRESILTEDKIVKFDGTTYPKDGWCLIMCGGPGSGKSTVLKNIIPINAKIYDADAIKQYAVKHGEIADNELILNGKHYDIPDDIEPPYNLDNSDYVSYLHNTLKPLNKRIKNNMFKMGADNGRLPNIAFDITGSDIEDFTQIIDNAIPLGYKVCIIWVLGTLQMSLDNNAARARKVKKDIVLTKYHDVITTVPRVIDSPSIMSKVNDFWVVFSVAYNIKTQEGRYKFIKDTNVDKVSSEDSINSLTDRIVDMINTQQEVSKQKLAELGLDS